MIDWLNKGARQNRRRQRRWRILGLLLVGIAIAVYWFDRKTSNAFEHTPNHNRDQSPRSPDARQPPVSREPVATAGQRTPLDTAASPESIRTAGGGAATSTASSQTDAEDIPEPNTAAEDEAIVKGETGQLAASQSSGDQTGSDSAPSNGAGSSGDGESATTTSEQLAEAGPVPTTTGGLVQGDGTHDCPDGFPIKGNASSRIYHLPGESTYEVTIPEVCFATEQDATAAGYRPRKH